MDLRVVKAEGLTIVRQADAAKVAGDIRGQGSRSLRPPAQMAQRVEAAVDRRGASAGGDYGLAIGDQVELGQAFDHNRLALDGLLPGHKATQIVAIAANGRLRAVFPPQALDEAGHPVRVVRSLRLANCTQCQPPR